MRFPLKYLFAFLLTLPLATLTVANSIAAIVNDTIITLDSINAQAGKKASTKQKIALLERQIDIELQKERIQALGIVPKDEAIGAMLDNIAKQNNLTIAQLRSNDEFEKIVEIVTQNLAFAGLEQVILQQVSINIIQTEVDEILANNPKQAEATEEEHIANIKMQLIRAKQNAFFQNWVKNLRKNAHIEMFANKLK
jgi:hypothetical protein